VLRPANLRLATGICLLALVLALPIVSFGGLSARDQLARLESGRTPADKFDWGAMRFDFGPAGRRALEKLAASPNPLLAGRARKALEVDSRWAIETHVAPKPVPRPLLTVDGGAVVPAALADAIGRTGTCTLLTCRLLFASPERAVVLSRACDTCEVEVSVFRPTPSGGWGLPAPPPPVVTGSEGAKVPLQTRRVEVRTVERKQVFVDGKPSGAEFD
jgi:hypothetical protein